MRPQRLDEELFDKLISQYGADLISIVIPTQVRGREVAQNPIRFKNQLSAVEEQMEDLGWKPRERAERLKSAQNLQEDHEFWEHQSEGLAVYVDDEGALSPVALSHDPDPASWISSVFVVRPLLTELTAVRLQTLALSRDFVGLYSASTRSVREYDADLPDSFDDVNWFVDREKQRQQHPDRVGTARSRHGHDPSSKEDEDLARFLREVGAALPPTVNDLPLLVLGDDDLVARFAALSDRETISPENSGFSVPVSMEQIHEMAVPSIEAVTEQRTDELIAVAKAKLELGQATSDIAEAVTAAISGRVEQVVIDVGADPIWGRIDEAELEVAVTQDPTPSDVDLLDRLVVLARRNGADVSGVTQPVDGKSFVATMRF